MTELLVVKNAQKNYRRTSFQRQLFEHQIRNAEVVRVLNTSLVHFGNDNFGSVQDSLHRYTLFACCSMDRNVLALDCISTYGYVNKNYIKDSKFSEAELPENKYDV